MASSEHESRGAGRSRHGLEMLGLTGLGTQHWNLSPAQLTEFAVRRGECMLASNGALNTATGKHTGRSPKDKFVVEEPGTRNEIWWGPVNQPISPDRFNALLNRVREYLRGREVFVFDGFAGADPDYTLPIRVVNENAWQNLFVHQLFRRPDPDQLANHLPQFTVLSAPGFKADPERDGTRSEAFVLVSFEQKIVLIGGTNYAGEQKKSIFGVLNYLLPKRGVVPMHCSVNVGADDDVALFFGLSGTGKTTLSADPDRRLIGDDEHGWSDNGIFNFEGGCYAKCIDLSHKYEPLIWDAIRFGCVLENVAIDPVTRVPDYTDSSLTENTRAAYPLEFIDNAVLSGRAGHPTAILFLSADAFGVLPPVSALTPDQARYYFLAGYTSKLAGTEVGVTEPEPEFSACFGAPFLPLSPTVYSQMLGEYMEKHRVPAYLVNTGWTGGPFGVGHRFPIDHTRAIVKAAIRGDLQRTELRKDPVFGLSVPTTIEGVPADVLDPRKTWSDPDAYDRQAKSLAKQFAENFKKFPDAAPQVAAAGPKADG